jgi:hypothetical protein
VFDARARFLRPINGIPGSSLFGKPVDLPVPIRRAVMAPGGQAALVVSDQPDGEVLLARNLAGPEPSAVLVQSALRDPDLISWAEDGASAVICSSRTAQLQVITGLDSSPQAGQPVAIPDGHGEVTAIALASDRSKALFAAFDAASGAVYLLDLKAPENIVRLLALSGRAAVIQLANGERDIVVADSATGDVWYVESIREGQNAFTIAGPRDGLNRPGCLQTIGNGQILIGDSGANTVFLLDGVNLTISRRIRLTASPERFGRSLDGRVTVISDDRSGQVLLLDPRDDSLFFVPMSQ